MAKRKNVAREIKLKKAYLFVLKVSFMIAALDGEVAESEFKAFYTAASQFLGVADDELAEAMDEAMYAAGYLILYRQHAGETALLQAFWVEVQHALKIAMGKSKYLFDKKENVRHSFLVWEFMALADGRYLKVERKAIACLLKNMNNGTLPLFNGTTGVTSAFLKKGEQLFEDYASRLNCNGERRNLAGEEFEKIQFGLCRLIDFPSNCQVKEK